MLSVTDVPKAFTPPGGYGRDMPPPILSGCVEPIVEGAPDLRGLWRAVAGTDEAGNPLPDGHPALSHVERIEQAGNRVVITTSGIVHDMYADGSFENGVNDVMAADFVTPICVAASFEDGALVLRPKGLADVEIRRWRDGDRLRWRYHTAFTATLERI